MNALTLGRISLLIVFVVVCSGSIDDPAKAFEVLSRNENYRFTVTPDRELSSFGTSSGILFRRDDDVGWQPLWSRRLINDEMPLRAVVADSGEYVITLGDRGEYPLVAIACYSRGGRLSFVALRQEATLALYGDAATAVDDEGRGVPEVLGETLEAVVAGDGSDLVAFVAPNGADFFVVNLVDACRVKRDDVGEKSWNQMLRRINEAVAARRAGEHED